MTFLEWLMLVCGLVALGLLWRQACREDARQREAAARFLRLMEKKGGRDDEGS